MRARPTPLPDAAAAGALGAALALAACAAPAPLDAEPAAVLAELDAVRAELAGAPPDPQRPPIQGAFDPRDGLDADEAAAFAVARNPALQAARAELGVGQALIVQAGLLPDPTFGWNAVDWLVGRERDDVLTGFSFTMPLPAPGERVARRELAEAELAVERVRVLAAEWELERRTRLAWLELVAIEERLALQARVTALLTQTADFLSRQREARTATGLQAELAILQRVGAELRGSELQRGRVEARLGLNRLLGLPPDVEVPLADAQLDRAAERPALDGALDERLARRPDVAEALARMQAAEEDVALAAARRGPSFYVGTAFGVVLPIFSRANRPQLDVALARRDRTFEELRARLFEARSALALAERRHELARARVAQAEQALEPALASLAERLEAARASRAVSAIDLVAAQVLLVDAARALLETRIEEAQTRVDLRAAAGPPPAPDPEPGPTP